MTGRAPVRQNLIDGTSGRRERKRRVGIAASVGLIIGVAVGLALSLTGVFSPLGTGLLGAVYLGAAIGGLGAAIGGLLNFWITSRQTYFGINTAYSSGQSADQRPSSEGERPQFYPNTEAIRPSAGSPSFAFFTVPVAPTLLDYQQLQDEDKWTLLNELLAKDIGAACEVYTSTYVKNVYEAMEELMASGLQSENDLMQKTIRRFAKIYQRVNPRNDADNDQLFAAYAEEYCNTSPNYRAF